MCVVCTLAANEQRGDMWQCFQGLFINYGLNNIVLWSKRNQIRRTKNVSIILFIFMYIKDCFNKVTLHEQPLVSSGSGAGRRVN